MAIVGTTKTNAQGNYTAVLKNQEYPIVRPNTARPASTRRTAGPAQARWSRSTTRVVSAEFIAPVINYDAKLQA